jgi:DNA-binding response OmpR family regulator
MSKTILIVDDEPDLCEILSYNLNSAGYDTIVAHSGAEALKEDYNQVDLVLLDVMMPAMSGIEVARNLRSRQDAFSVPIIFLTALDGEQDKLDGFDAGADDYMSKPFSVKELIARIKAVLSRSDQHRIPTVVTYDQMIVNHDDKAVVINGNPIELSRLEFDILWLLMTHRGHVYSREELMKEAWPPGVIVSARTIDVNITRIRKKIEPYSQCLCTRHGYGYYFTNENENEKTN